MSTQEIRALIDIPMQLGECPIWHPEESSLYWIDIAGKAVHCFNLVNSRHRMWSLPTEPGCIARSSDSKILVAMRSGITFLDTNDGSLTPVADSPYDPSLMRFNDGRCDTAGRLWVGTLYEPRDRPGGSLFCVDRGTMRDAEKPVTVSNGVAFSLDGRTLYHSDTTAHRITAYDFDMSSGQIGTGRIFKQFSADKSNNYGGRPDGAAIDSEGAYWCAMYEGGRILRLSPEGEVLREITLPVRCPTMVAFGGTNLKTLFITTARHNRTEVELRSLPLSGYVLTMQVEIAGCIEPPYRP